MIGAISKIIEEIILPISSSVKDEVINIASNRLLEYTISEYKRNSTIKTFLHRSVPVKITDIYEPLFLKSFHSQNSISTNNVSNVLIDLDIIEKKISEKDREHRIKEIIKKHKLPKETSVEDLENNNSIKESDKKYIKDHYKPKGNFTITGDAGGGKTTLTKYLIVNIIEENLGIPLLIELRKLNNYNGNLIDYIYKEVFGFYDLSISEDITERLLRSGKFFIILDGYDEIVSDKISETTSDIERFSVKFSKNRYILTTRPYTQVELLSNFVNYEIKKLEYSKVRSFITRQLPKEQSIIIEDILKIIEENRKSNYMVFLSNPLLLSMFILTFQSYSVLPNKMSIFYQNVFDTLYHTHDSLSKMMFQREKKSRLNKPEFEKLLTYFSFISNFEQKYTFDKIYFSKKLKEIGVKNPSLRINEDDILHDMLVSVPLLLKEGLNLSFTHRGLQEYFTALFIANILDRRIKLKFYKNLFLKLKDSGRQIGEFYNLYTLLEEVDEIDLYRFLVLPYLKLLIKSGEEGEEQFNELFEDYKTFIKIIFKINQNATLWGHRSYNAKYSKMNIRVTNNGNYLNPYLFDDIRNEIDRIEEKIEQTYSNENFVTGILDSLTKKDE